MSDLLYAQTLAKERPGAARCRRRLIRQVHHVLRRPACQQRIVRLAQPVGAIDPFGWLRAQPMAPKGYWSGRGDEAAVAMAGVADVCSGTPDAFEAAEARLVAGDPGARYYGGMRFDLQRALDEAWQAFGTAQLVLPRFELHAAGGEEDAVLLCNLVLPQDTSRVREIMALIERLAFPEGREAPALPTPVARANHPEKEAWQRAVRQALASIREGALEKVVLARKAVFDFAAPIDPVVLLERLKAATPGCFHFCLQPAGAPAAAFIGASPERLIRREGARLWSEAVAGTRPRGASEDADARLRVELLGSDKERREHAFVLRSLRRRLEALSASVDAPGEAEAMMLARGQHLCVPLRATLRPEVTTAQLLRALHPTPAVGGTPTGAALRAIRQQEPFDRGWYAGPVGWVSARAAEFAVGIRSGLVRGRRLALFSGGGIVEGSVPADEWDEVEQKIADFLQVLF